MKKFLSVTTVFLSLLVCTLVVVQVWLLNRNSTSGEYLTNLNLKIQQVEAQNDTFREQIASASALSTISKRALDIGLTPTIIQLSLTTPAVIAYTSHPTL
jgi:hypothetical protein